MRTIAISNYKGGVGKTTTAVNLAAIYTSRGKRVLLIDLDPQASATDYYGLYDKARSEGRTSVELLYEGASVADIAYPCGDAGLSVIPSVIELVDQIVHVCVDLSNSLSLPIGCALCDDLLLEAVFSPVETEPWPCGVLHPLIVE